jgi:Mg2+ and Co2+ transporter CorA
LYRVWRNLVQAVAVTGDLSAMTDHVAKLNELVVTTVGHANNNANLTLALLGTVFLPLTWIAGA